MLKAVIFDFDGVLGDTEHLQLKKWNIVLGPYGIEITDEEYGNVYAGKSSVNVVPGMLKERFPQITCSTEELAQAALKEIKRLFATEKIKPLPGTVEALQFIKAKSLKMAVASGRTLVEIAEKLDASKLSEWFPVEYRITQADANFRGKPDPGMYRFALTRLGVSGDEAAIFEDTVPGVVAGKAAGAKVVALPSIYSRHYQFEEADLVIRGGWAEVMEKWPMVENLCR